MFRNQSNKYDKFIVSELKIPPNQVEPHKFYRLRAYRKGAKNTEYYEGNDSVYLFSTGIYLEKLYCLKLSSIEPDTFFTWFRAITRDFKVLLEDVDTVDMHRLAPIIDRGGRMVYEIYIKNYAKLNKLENPYRSYDIDKIVELFELKMSTKELKNVVI